MMIKIKKYLFTFILLGLGVVYIIPLIITLSNSFMPEIEIIRNLNKNFVTMPLIPNKFSMSQYRRILMESPVYLRMYWNSIYITSSIIIATLLIAPGTAYAFTVLNFKYKETLYFIYICIMILPLTITLVPNYIVMDFFNLHDNWLAIILPGIFNPFAVFLLRQQLKVFPEEIIEAAEMEGAGHFIILIKIVYPLIKSGIAACVLLIFIDYWNLIDQAVVFINSMEKQPLSVFLSYINRDSMGVSFAAASFYVFPSLLFLFYGIDNLKTGIVLASIKY